MHSIPLPFSISLLTPWLDPEPFPDLAGIKISKQFQEIIASTDSLTKRLETHTASPSLVRLENQHLQSDWEDLPEIWTPDYQIHPPHAALLRNAWLTLGKQDLIFAHSQLSLTSMTETTQHTIQQGEQPLGSLFLARDEQVQRQRLQLAAANLPTLASRLNWPESHRFICRRSLFFVANELCGRILEIFLTDLSS